MTLGNLCFIFRDAGNLRRNEGKSGVGNPLFLIEMREQINIARLFLAACTADTLVASITASEESQFSSLALLRLSVRLSSSLILVLLSLFSLKPRLGFQIKIIALRTNREERDGGGGGAGGVGDSVCALRHNPAVRQ